MIETLALVVAFALANRWTGGEGYLIPELTGGGFIKLPRPGSPALFPSMTLIPIVAIWFGWAQAAAICGLFFLWRIVPSDWGESLDMGRSPEPHERGVLGRAAAFFIARQPHLDYLTFTFRMWPVLAFVPLSLWIPGVWPVVAVVVLVPLTYLIKFRVLMNANHEWRYKGIEPTTLAELTSGAWWGLLLAL